MKYNFDADNFDGLWIKKFSKRDKKSFQKRNIDTDYYLSFDVNYSTTTLLLLT
jgi:hypothetical protein